MQYTSRDTQVPAVRGMRSRLRRRGPTRRNHLLRPRSLIAHQVVILGRTDAPGHQIARSKRTQGGRSGILSAPE
jgi:hypothetical protein